MSQREAILDALEHGETLTPLDALKRFGCFRLGARIWDLKQAGHQIEMRLIETASGKRVAEYFIAELILSLPTSDQVHRSNYPETPTNQYDLPNLID